MSRYGKGQARHCLLQRRVSLCYTVLGLSLAVFGWHCGGGHSPGASASAPLELGRFAVEEGERLYQEYCSPCHGESGRGDGRFWAYALEPVPADFSDPSFLRMDRQLYRAISEGSASIGKSDLCPPWGKTFSSTEIEYLIVHIRQLRKNSENALENRSGGGL